MPNEKKIWFFRAADGTETGPLAESGLHERVVSGEIASETPVSRGDGVWKPALAFDECGFDCLVLRTEPSLDVLGPFSREYLDRPDILETLPGEGRFFVRSGTVADAAASGTPGSSGSALVERVLSAERALRDTVGKLGELGKLLSELDAAKKALAAKSSALDTANKTLAATMAESGKSAKDLADAKKSLVGKESELKAAKKSLAAKDAELDAAKKALASKDAELNAAKKSLAEKESALAALRRDAEWMRGAVSGLLAEAGRRFGAKGASDAVPAPEVVEPEIVEDPPKPGPAPDPERERTAKMAALESQLQKELRMAGSAPLRNLFKKR